jgi:plastocyanin
MVLMATLAASSFPLTSVFSQLQPPTTQQEGEPEVESDGGLTATLNGETFGKGDTIIISGTVAERESGSTVYARIYDPDSIELDFKNIHVNTDGTFRQGFVAGEDSLNDGTSDPMTKSGTYTIALEYSPPGNADTESTEVTFEYDAEAPAAVGGEDDSATIAEAGPTTTFQNLTEGFRIQVPNGWVADDNDVSDSVRQAFIASNGYEFLGLICAQDDALPKIGGLYECPTSAVDGVSIVAYPNLHTRPEFARVINQNQTITLPDIVALDIEELKSRITNPDIASRISIESQTETTVNVVDPSTGQAVQALPATEVVYGVPAIFGDTIFVKYALLVLADNGTTGYILESSSEENIELDDEMPTPVRQAFDSFELLTPSSRPNATNSSSPQEQSQQQLEQSAGGLTARLNANNFTTGDTITVNGTVADRNSGSDVFVQVIDPQGNQDWAGFGTVTADNTYQVEFKAGEPQNSFSKDVMNTSGNYLMKVSFGTDRIEFTFNYNASVPVSEAATSTAPPTPQTQQQEQPQLQEQNQGASVSIVSGSSSLTDTAFSPNPVEVSVGDTVTWTNDDTQPHTVTSGSNATPDGKFDSSPNFNPLLASGQKFEHTFTEAGEYPYFCMLHPNMVGTVIVS